MVQLSGCRNNTIYWLGPRTVLQISNTITIWVLSGFLRTLLNQWYLCWLFLIKDHLFYKFYLIIGLLYHVTRNHFMYIYSCIILLYPPLIYQYLFIFVSSLSYRDRGATTQKCILWRIKHCIIRILIKS